ncbi:DNA-directed RNA polymerase subunit beta [Carnobacterium iners]|uniref:DNA-directed RNA polymerase subunit beta n=1 Tax=Carnobacterium iners TaxID=1073423 RepID=A0A1X7N7V1_9LACT|nr:DNA-directed RNA polymerase subunit beta [Carnobacterium iners]SEK45395.1 DNA-directed RNA polymerase subunit beta [Carnobacterium iners]SMH32919.1 DNA-directed RNA polymerase subunit beta [Carnobacterium iners]
MTKGKIAAQMGTFILKILLVIVVVAIALILGAMVGYGIIGEGNPFAIFEMQTWSHIFSYFTKPTIING